MRRSIYTVLVSFSFALIACDGESPSGTDAGPMDAAMADGGRVDGGPTDVDGGGACEGCVSSMGDCLPGDTEASCGAGGSACAVCDGDEVCVEGGMCLSPPDCDSSNCDGCCSGDTCVETPDDAQCGAGGAECTSCLAPATCNDGGCANPCDADTCGGCCGAEGCVELEDQGASECGRGAEVCGGCGVDEMCVEGVCVDTGCAADCDGCCISGSSGATCIAAADTSPSACGVGGNACRPCDAGSLCNDGRCEVDLSTTWDVVAIDGVVPERNLDDNAWDPFGGLPDPYVRITVGSDDSEVTGQSAHQNDTLMPVWNETVLSGVTAGQIVDRMVISVFDRDPFSSDDLIGTCTAAYDPSRLPSIIRWTCPRNPEAGNAGWEVRLRVEPAED